MTYTEADARELFEKMANSKDICHEPVQLDGGGHSLSCTCGASMMVPSCYNPNLLDPDADNGKTFIWMLDRAITYEDHHEDYTDIDVEFGRDCGGVFCQLDFAIKIDNAWRDRVIMAQGKTPALALRNAFRRDWTHPIWFRM